MQAEHCRKNYTQEELGLRIRQLRKINEWSQAQLAQRLRVDRSCMCRLENGQREPTLQQLAELGQLFEVPLDYLVYGSGALQVEKAGTVWKK